MSVELKIFDVRHGFCAALIIDKILILIDCGHDAESFRPLEWLRDRGFNRIDVLIISNFDQDHISSMKYLVNHFAVSHIFRNCRITPEQLRQLKIRGGGLSEEMNIVLRSISKPEYAPQRWVDLPIGTTSVQTYGTSYPYAATTNDLSLVTFIRLGNSNIIIPGDLETTGWQLLLAIPEFVADLRKVTVFVASHHGRINGYCPEVFKFCSPEVVIISDKEKVHSTQDHNRYEKHAKGIFFGGKTILDSAFRKVLTTRKDGHLTIYPFMDNAIVIPGL